MRVLLVNPPDDLDVMLGSGQVFVQPAEPLGILSIAATLQAEGHQVSVLDAYALHLDPEQVFRRIEEAQPEVVGLGVLTCQGRVVYHLGRRLKRAHPDLLVVLGNVHAATFAEAYVTEGCADLVVHGEGETALVRILREARGARRWQTLPGLTYRDAAGQARSTGGVLVEPDLAALPPPARDLVAPHLYGGLQASNRNFVPSARRRMMSLSTSRGCPYGCSFCAVAADRRTRALPAERVVDELEQLERTWGAGYVFMVDPLFGGQAERLAAIARGIRERGLRVPWGCTTHVNAIRPDVVTTLASANCYELSLGFESGVQRHLDAIGKRTTPERGMQAARTLRDYSDIRIEGLFILGLPGETPDETLRTLLFACRLPIQMAQFSLFTPYPGSPAFERLAAANDLDTGLRADGSLDPDAWLRYSAYPGFGSVQPVWVTPAYTARELMRMQKLALRAFYLRPAKLLEQALKLRPSSASALLRGAWRGLM